MNTRKAKQPGTAVVTGVSSGIGAAFAHALAAQGYDLVLVARRAGRLEDLAATLQHTHRISVDPWVADLADAHAVSRLAAHLAMRDQITLLVNNAGFGTAHLFAVGDLDQQVAMIQVHILAPVRLTYAVLPGLIARGREGIINVASIGAFMPAPRNVTYSATKAYLVVFSTALQQELAGTGVRVQALCPGFTPSEFYDHAEYATFDRSRLPGVLWTPTETVVAASLQALRRGPVVYIPGLKNRLLVALWRSGLGPLLWQQASRGFAPRAPVVPAPGTHRAG